ncbi:MAG: RtcB family protein, partial [Chloroflexota bacterium]
MSEIHLQPKPYQVWGREQIDTGALDQMDNAMRLPVSVAGALMPDAHVGYGLPIGGVLAVQDVVIPYAVGVDIACRMRMTIYDAPPGLLRGESNRFENLLLENTLFGAGGGYSGRDRAEHAVLDDPDWQATGFLNNLQDKAYAQLGTSGSGNHFVEWGAFTLEHDDPGLGLSKGDYLALLSHSGSRGVGFAIAERFSKLAMEQHPDLDKSLRHLAWLDLNSQLGQEYWVSMQLAGKFAAANHAVIHQRVTRAAGLKVAATIENHHNFAWEETLIAATGESQRVIVHRKGATPAGPGVLGIIPGSMGDPGFVVRGKGSAAAVNSAAHGAGRRLSRSQAKKTITQSQQKQYLRER